MPRMRQTEVILNPAVARLQGLPQPVVAYGRDLDAGDVLPSHHHQRAQFVYAANGVMTVTTPGAAFVVPSQRAVWVPSGIEHQIEARSQVAMRTLYVEADDTLNLPDRVCVLQVTPLLRELIIEAVAAGPDCPAGSPLARIMAVILDQIRVQPVASLALPMPSEPRVDRIVQALIADPGSPKGLDEWSSDVGASKRTMSRLFAHETGMSFRAWRQQLRAHRAIELLVAGASVTTTAYELGYDNTSAFIAMFRRCLGTTPARYLRGPDIDS